MEATLGLNISNERGMRMLSIFSKAARLMRQSHQQGAAPVPGTSRATRVRRTDVLNMVTDVTKDGERIGARTDYRRLANPTYHSRNPNSEFVTPLHRLATFTSSSHETHVASCKSFTSPFAAPTEERAHSAHAYQEQHADTVST